MKRFLSLLIAATATLGMAAQGTTVLTLDDCRREAVAANAAVKIAKADAEAATAVRREAFTKYFPTVAASGTYFKSSKPVLRYDVMNLFTLEMIDNGTFATISAVQPLFAGGRIVNGNRLARVGEEAARIEQQGATDDVVLQVEEYYWNIVSLKAKKKTLQSVLTMTDTLVSHIGAAVDAGIVLPNDLLKVKLRNNEYRALMVDLDNGINLSLKQLAQYVGRDGQSIDIDNVEVPDQVPPYPRDLFVNPADALPLTTDYRLLQAAVKGADLKKSMVVGEYLPTVGVGAGLFYDNLLSQSHSFGAVFLNVSVPISSWWGGSYAIKKSNIEAQNARTRRDDLGQMLTLRMDNSWDNLTSAHRKMEIEHESIEQATENLRLNLNYYNAGVSTITDVLDAQTLYRQASDGFTEAYCNFCSARARYLDATARSSF